jgi:Domain of unknown function (DUF4263)
MSARRANAHRSGPLTRRFTILRNVPPPWSWDHYSAWVQTQWVRLLRTADPLAEEPFHRFLERHPCLIPGGEGSGESFGGHHGGWHHTVITRPPLPGINKRVPDFMWLTKNSEDIIPVLVEIEAPGKPWFSKDGQRSAKLTQAQDQLAEWRQQLDNAANRQLLAEMYDFPRRWTYTHNLVPRFLLIYGRAEEMERRPELNRKRQMVRGQATEAMTFDRLRPLAGSSNAITVRMEGGSPVVIAIPPTFRVGPTNAEAISAVKGWSRAIGVNRQIDRNRKDFLLNRLPYWTDLGGRSRDGSNLGPHDDTDWE